MSKSPKTLALSEKVFGALLRLYPQSHRREYAEAMMQLFCDECRDAWREGHTAGVARLWLRVLADLAKTCVLEHINERKQTMNNITTKNSPVLLLIIGLALGLLSFQFVHSDAMRLTGEARMRLLQQERPLFHFTTALLFIGASLAVLLAKAVVELFRPGREWKRILIGTIALVFVFGFYTPAWAKLCGGDFDSASNGYFWQVAFKYSLEITLLANLIVAVLVKPIQVFSERKRG